MHSIGIMISSLNGSHIRDNSTYRENSQSINHALFITVMEHWSVKPGHVLECCWHGRCTLLLFRLWTFAG